MLLNLNQEFITMDGLVMQDIQDVIVGHDDTGAPVIKKKFSNLVLGRIAKLALLEPPVALKVATKTSHFELVLKLNTAKAGVIELEAEEISLIKTAVIEKFGVLISGEARRMLEGKDPGITRVEIEPKREVSEPGLEPQRAVPEPEQSVIKN